MLKKITQTLCACGAGIEQESRERQHSNGNWNEFRKFKCGLTLTYSPNFDKLELANKCRHSKEAKAQEAKRERALESTNKHINSLNVDAAYRDKLLYALKYC